MRLDDCYYLGQIRKAHGIRGEVKVYLDVDEVEEYQDLESVYVLEGSKLTPFFIDDLRLLTGQLALVKFRNVLDRDQAESLYEKELYLPLEFLPEMGSDSAFYYHEIVGFQVMDAQLGALGTVVRVEEMPAQDLILMAYKGHEVLIPVSRDIVPRIDREAQTLHCILPPGYLEIYLPSDDPEEE